MSSSETLASNAGGNSAPGYIKILGNPWLDRAIAVIASVPFVYGVSDALSIFGLAIVIWGRFSLGRNIGFIPAQRELAIKGAYQYMRHPVYTNLFVVYLAVALRIYSPRNAVLIAIGMFWFVLKSFVEENFLKSDPRYAAYMQRVRARWIPFIV